MHGYWLFTADGKCKTGAKVRRKQIHTITRGSPRRDTCSLATYNRVNVIQDMWASAHLVFGTWAPQQTASLRLGPECRSPAGTWLGLVPVRASTLEGVYWSSEDLCWGNANGKVKSPQRARKCCLGKALWVSVKGHGVKQGARGCCCQIKTALELLLYCFAFMSPVVLFWVYRDTKANWRRQAYNITHVNRCRLHFISIFGKTFVHRQTGEV